VFLIILSTFKFKNNIKIWITDVIRESSRRQTLSLPVTALDAIVRHYMVTHDNNTPPTCALPKQPLCVREVIVSDCSVLRSRDGANNEMPYAHLICLHPAGQVRKKEVIDSFAYVRPVSTDDDDQQANDAQEEMVNKYEVPMQLDEGDLTLWDAEIIAQPATIARVAKQTRRVRRLQTTDTQEEADLKPAAAVAKVASQRLRALQSAGGSGGSASAAQHRGKQRMSRKRVADQSENVTPSANSIQPYGPLPSTDGMDVMDDVEKQDQAEQNIISW
jgi:hypothetical protein